MLIPNEPPSAQCSPQCSVVIVIKVRCPFICLCNKRDERLMKDMKKPRAHIINHTKVTHSIKKRRHNDTHIYAKSTHKTYDEEKMRRETKNMCHPCVSKLDKRAEPYG